MGLVVRVAVGRPTSPDRATCLDAWCVGWDNMFTASEIPEVAAPCSPAELVSAERRLLHY